MLQDELDVEAGFFEIPLAGLQDQLLEAPVNDLAAKLAQAGQQKEEILRHHFVNHPVEQWVVKLRRLGQPPIQVHQELIRYLGIILSGVGDPELAQLAELHESLSTRHKLVEVCVEISRDLGLWSLALLGAFAVRTCLVLGD